MGQTPRPLKQKRRGGDQGIFVLGDGELRPWPGRLIVAIVTHSVLDNVCKLAIGDPSLDEEVCGDWAPVVATGHNLFVSVVDNDLTDDVSFRTLIDRHLNQARACIEGLGAKTVIVGSAMHRQSVRGRMFATEYNDRVDSFNRDMKRVLCRGDMPMCGDLDIWRFRYRLCSLCLVDGIHPNTTATKRLYFRYRLCSLCLVDGIHPNTTATKRLYFSIRLALKNAGKILSCQ